MLLACADTFSVGSRPQSLTCSCLAGIFFLFLPSLLSVSQSVPFVLGSATSLLEQEYIFLPGERVCIAVLTNALHLPAEPTLSFQLDMYFPDTYNLLCNGILQHHYLPLAYVHKCTFVLLKHLTSRTPFAKNLISEVCEKQL